MRMLPLSLLDLVRGIDGCVIQQELSIWSLFCVLDIVRIIWYQSVLHPASQAIS